MQFAGLSVYACCNRLEGRPCKQFYQYKLDSGKHKLVELRKHSREEILLPVVPCNKQLSIYVTVPLSIYVTIVIAIKEKKIANAKKTNDK